MDFDHNKYKVWKLPNLLLVHWVLNPGLAFNELILGQRLPKITLIDKTSDAPLMERQYVPCPHCNEIHDGSIWAKRGGFQNWFGLLCPTCNNIIPCLWNVTSLILLTITFPIWGLFKNSLKTRWKKFKVKQYQVTKDKPPASAKTTSYLMMGLVYGGLMFCFMALPKILTEVTTSEYVMKQAITWLVAGLAFAGVMKLVLGRKNKTKG